MWHVDSDETTEMPALVRSCLRRRAPASDKTERLGTPLSSSVWLTQRDSLLTGFVLAAGTLLRGSACLKSGAAALADQSGWRRRPEQARSEILVADEARLLVEESLAVCSVPDGTCRSSDLDMTAM